MTPEGRLARISAGLLLRYTADMKPISKLRVPIFTSLPAGVTVNSRNFIPSERYGEFQLLRINHSANICQGGRLFYECCLCGSAGCPSWNPSETEIPEEVMDHLYVHAGLCRGVEGSTARP